MGGGYNVFGFIGVFLTHDDVISRMYVVNSGGVSTDSSQLEKVLVMEARNIFLEAGLGHWMMCMYVSIRQG